MIRQYFYRIKTVFQIMCLLLKSSYYNQKLLIINFIILLCEYYFTRSECHRTSIVIFVLLIENARNNKIKDFNFHSISFQEIIMNKKKEIDIKIFLNWRNVCSTSSDHSNEFFFFSFLLFLSKLINDAAILK